MARKSKTTIQAEVNKLLLRRTPLTYEQIVSRVHEKHPDCHTTVKTVKTVQWYASRLRKTGADVRVRTSHDRRDWRNRPAQKPRAEQAAA